MTSSKMENLVLTINSAGIVIDSIRFTSVDDKDAREKVGSMDPLPVGFSRTLFTNVTPVNEANPTAGDNFVELNMTFNYELAEGIRRLTYIEVDCKCGHHTYSFPDRQPPAAWKTTCPHCLVKFEAIKVADQWRTSYEPATRKHSIALLQQSSELTTVPVYILVENDYMYRVDKSRGENLEENLNWVNEHTCPTNLINGMNVAICAPGVFRGNVSDKTGDYNCDPHGFFKLINVVSIEELKASIEGADQFDWECLQEHEEHAILVYMLAQVGKEVK